MSDKNKDATNVVSLDEQSPGFFARSKEWALSHKLYSGIIATSLVVAIGGGGYLVHQSRADDIIPTRASEGNASQGFLPEAKVIDGQGAGTIAVIDNEQDGKIVSAPMVGIDGIGTQEGASLVPPEDVTQVGYYVRSAPFGSDGAGSSVITSHINYSGVTGFGAIFTSLKKGDPITVTSSDGVEHHYVVTEDPVNVNKSDPEYVRKTLNTINDMDGSNSLVLVTCGGEYLGDGSPLGYADNIVVNASPVKSLGEIENFS